MNKEIIKNRKVETGMKGKQKKRENIKIRNEMLDKKVREERKQDKSQEVSEGRKKIRNGERKTE
jgi:hypothetical protein